MGFDYVGINIAKLNHIIAQLVTMKSHVDSHDKHLSQTEKFCLGEGEETIMDGLLPLEPYKRGGSSVSFNCLPPPDVNTFSYRGGQS